MHVFMMTYDDVIDKQSLSISIKPNTHPRRRRDETVESRRVGVGGVYWALQRQYIRKFSIF